RGSERTAGDRHARREACPRPSAGCTGGQRGLPLRTARGDRSSPGPAPIVPNPAPATRPARGPHNGSEDRAIIAPGGDRAMAPPAARGAFAAGYWVYCGTGPLDMMITPGYGARPDPRDTPGPPIGRR